MPSLRDTSHVLRADSPLGNRHLDGDKLPFLGQISRYRSELDARIMHENESATAQIFAQSRRTAVGAANKHTLVLPTR